MNTKNYWIDKLNLLPHPEGGFYKEVYRSEGNIPSEVLPNHEGDSRSYLTSIYFLLGKNDISHFHILSSDEIWYYNQGCSCIIHKIDLNGNYSSQVVGPEGEMQVIIPNNTYFAAEVISKIQNDSDDFILVSCAVAPGFDFNDFRLVAFEELNSICSGQEQLIRKFT